MEYQEVEALSRFPWAGMPGEGFEPPTFGLQNRCTTTVLTRLEARQETQNPQKTPVAASSETISDVSEMIQMFPVWLSVRLVPIRSPRYQREGWWSNWRQIRRPRVGH